MENYELLDSGAQQKLERFGPFLIVRPCSQALWKPSLPKKEWDGAHAHFSREEGRGWVFHTALPKRWVVEIEGVRFHVAPTDFGHLGVFPEHSLLWPQMRCALKRKPGAKVLNLFAYSGGATLALAQAGAQLCHLDASKGMVAWARENAELNELSAHPIRWIIDDVMKLLQREVRRGARYDAIVLDPPSFGRGSHKEVFKIEQAIHPLLDLCVQLLSEDPLFLTLTTHTPGMTPVCLHARLSQKLRGEGQAGGMVIPSKRTFPLPCGSFVSWRAP